MLVVQFRAISLKEKGHFCSILRFVAEESPKFLSSKIYCTSEKLVSLAK